MVISKSAASRRAQTENPPFSWAFDRLDVVTKSALSSALTRCLDSGLLPELGTPECGKVRDSYVIGAMRLIITTDRVSAFDRVFGQSVPFKGEVLNRLASYFLGHAQKIVPVHLVATPDPCASLVRDLRGYPVEVVVRGFVAGSAWRDYEAGVFYTNYGFDLPPGLGPNARLATPVVTATTKASSGHDQPLTARDAAELVGGDKIWGRIRDVALRLFDQGSSLAAARGLILADTKYEFGFDSGASGMGNPAIVLIDEVHTPDSSRYWTISSWEANKSAPEQLSKEYLRNWLLERGFTGEGEIPELPDKVRLELAARYLELYEKLTGEPLAIGNLPEEPCERLCRNLVKAGLIRGGVVGILLGSRADADFSKKVQTVLGELEIPTREWLVSAHKVPDKLHRHLATFNGSAEPLVWITIAGRSNGLSGIAAANSVHPVIALPALVDRSDYQINIHSSLQLPSETPALTVIDPVNAALAAARMLGLASAELKRRLACRTARARSDYTL